MSFPVYLFYGSNLNSFSRQEVFYPIAHTTSTSYWRMPVTSTRIDEWIFAGGDLLLRWVYHLTILPNFSDSWGMATESMITYLLGCA